MSVTSDMCDIDEILVVQQSRECIAQHVNHSATRDGDEVVVSHGHTRFMRTPLGGVYLEPEIRGWVGADVLWMLIQLVTERDAVIRRAESAEAEAHDQRSRADDLERALSESLTHVEIFGRRANKEQHAREIAEHQCDAANRRAEQAEGKTKELRVELAECETAFDAAERGRRAAEASFVNADRERWQAVDRAEKAEAERRADELSLANHKLAIRLERKNADLVATNDKLRRADATGLLYKNTLDALRELASGDEDAARQIVRGAHEMARSAGVEQRYASRYWSQISDAIRSLHASIAEHESTAKSNDAALSVALEYIDHLEEAVCTGAAHVERAQQCVSHGARGLSNDELLGEFGRRMSARAR